MHNLRPNSDGRIKDVRAYRHPLMNFSLFWILCSGSDKTSKNEIKNGGHRLRLGATGLNKNGRFRTYSIIVADLLVHGNYPLVIGNN